MNVRLFIIFTLTVGLAFFLEIGMVVKEAKSTTQPIPYVASTGYKYHPEPQSNHPESTRLQLTSSNPFTETFKVYLPIVVKPPAISFSGDWEQGLTGPGNWKYIQSVANNRFQLVTSPVRQGKYAVRVEVRPGDDPIDSSGERAEALRMTDENGGLIDEGIWSGTQYYAFSVMLDPNWQPPSPSSQGLWGIVFQLHGPDSLKTGPAFSLQAVNSFFVTIHSGDLDSSKNSFQWKSYPLSNNKLNQGQWVDFVIEIEFAEDFNGSIAIWRRDEGVTGFTQVFSIEDVPTLQYRSSQGGVGAHYWKHGFYRSDQTTITNILWIDGLTRAFTFDGAAHEAFPE